MKSNAGIVAHIFSVEHTQPVHRQLYKMKPRTQFFIVIGLLILGIALFTFSTRNQQPVQFFPAAINRDCAPWDGSAFTVSIPYESGSIIYVSIWQSPDLKLPVTFTFPDQTGRVGNATVLLRFSYSVQLTGKVFFWHVEQGIPVEGVFDLITEAGRPLKGRFKAEWGDEIVYCG